MSNSWRQIWEDLRNALRGAGAETSADAPATEASDTPPVPQSESAIDAKAVAQPEQVSSVGAYDPAVNAPTEARSLESEGSSLSGEPFTNVGSSAIGDLETVATGQTDSSADMPSSLAPPPRPRWRRVLEWSPIVIVIILLFTRIGWALGLEQIWAGWTAPQPPAPDVIATFDGGQLTLADLEAHLKLLVPEKYQASVRTPEGLQLLVREMVSDELVRRWASGRKFDADETFQHTMEHITEDVNLESFNTKLHEGGIVVPESEIQAYYEANRATFGDQSLSTVREQIRRELVGQKEDQYLKGYIERLKQNASITRNFELLDVPEPTERELQEYYQTNTQSYTVTAQFTVDLLQFPIGVDAAAARASADKALLALQSGVDFEQVPAQVAEARLISGTLVISGTSGAAWDTAVRALQPGEVSGVLRTDAAWEIVRLVGAQPARTQSFAEARLQVLTEVRRRQLDNWMQANAPKTLFMITSKQYSLGQFYQEYQELPASIRAQFTGSAGMKLLADQLIERLLLVEDTYDQLLQVENKEILDQTRLDVLRQMMDQEEIDDKIVVTDDEVRQYYDQNPDLMARPTQSRIRYIRVGIGTTDDERSTAEARINEAYQKLVPGPLQQGTEFAVVAKEYSEDPQTAAVGGELSGWVGETSDPFEPPYLHDLHQIILTLAVEQISAPFLIGDSYYIVQVIERIQPDMLSFEEVRPYIRDELTQQKHTTLAQQLEAQLTAAAGLVIYDQVIEAYAAQIAQAERGATK